VYYFTDTNQIQVFSLSQSQWLNPIPIPAPNGTTQRLWGLSLSPDGTKLAVADAQASVVYVLDPANPASIKTITISPSYPSGVLILPSGIAIGNSGVAYLVADVQGGTGFHNYFKLDTNTSVLTDLGIDGPRLGPRT
jgi:YVTN family beta-propeller protein